MTDPDLTPEAVERFDLEQPTEHMGSALMKPEQGYGDWVRYTDYAALSAAHAAALVREQDANVKALVEAATRLADAWDKDAMDGIGPAVRQVRAALRDMEGGE